jgi:hypothetical protein
MNTFIDIAKQKINESYKKNEITNEGLYHYLFDVLTEADKAIQVQAPVSPTEPTFCERCNGTGKL